MPVLRTYLGGQWVDVGGGAGGLTNPMTTAGDIIYGGTNGAPTRLAKGTDGQVLTLASGLPAWAAASGGGAIDWANTISVTGATTLTIGRHHVCSGTTADYTVTLPAVSGNAGKLLSVEMSGVLTKLVTLDGNASETIDGTTTRVMWARETAVLLCDGTQWTKVGGKSIPMIGILYNGTTTSITAATATKVPMNTLITDNTGMMCDTTTGTLTCFRDGRYHIVIYLFYLGGNNTDTYCQVKGYISGAFDTALLASGFYKAGVQATNILDTYITLLAGQYLNTYGFIGAGVGAQIYASPSCRMTLKEDPQW